MNCKQAERPILTRKYIEKIGQVPIMRSTSFLLLISVLLMFSCNNNCIEREIEDLEEFSDVNYHDIVSHYKEYLVQEGIVESFSKTSWLQFFSEKKYCNVAYEDYYGNYSDGLFDTSPNIGAAFYKCGNIKDVPFDSLNRDSVAEQGPPVIISFLETLSEDQFNNKYVEVFMVYYANVFYGLCD